MKYIVKIWIWKELYKNINNEKIVQTFMSKDILYQGRGNLQKDDGAINIYNGERVLVELIRKKK